jgi:hypothetical protein
LHKKTTLRPPQGWLCEKTSPPSAVKENFLECCFHRFCEAKSVETALQKKRYTQLRSNSGSEVLRG